MKNNLSKLAKLITSDNGVIVALLLLAALLAWRKSGFVHMLNAMMSLFLLIGVTSFVLSLWMVFSASDKDKFFIRLLFISIVLIIATSLGLYINNLEKMIVVAGLPGAALGCMIAFFSSR